MANPRASGLLAEVLGPADVEQEERPQQTVGLGMGLDKLTVHAVVLADLVLAAHIQIITELLDVHRVVEVLVLEVMHVLACGPVETHDGLARIWAGHIDGVDGHINAVGDTLTLRVSVLGRGVVRARDVGATVGGWRAIAAIESPGGLLVPEHVVLVLASDIGVVCVLIEDNAPWVVEATALKIDPARGASVTVVTVDLV